MSLGWFKPQRLPEGQTAPDFTLPSTAGDFHLHAQIKEAPVLMMFYMGDFGTSCTWALNKLVEITPELKAAGVQVYAISVNPMAMHRRFDARMNFPFALISDEGGAVTKEYGVLIEKHPIYQGMAGRAVYLIGKEGKILYSWVSEDDPAGSPDFQVLLRTVKGLV